MYKICFIFVINYQHVAVVFIIIVRVLLCSWYSRISTPRMMAKAIETYW